MDVLLSLAESILKYNFKRKEIGLEALMMAGGSSGSKGTVIYRNKSLAVDKNTRLAVVGDKVLDMVVSEAWYLTGTEKQRQNDARADLTSNKRLAERGKAIGLDQCIIRNDGTPRVSPDMMATTLEALIGAVFQDAGGKGAGLEAAEKVMRHLGFFNYGLFQGNGRSKKQKQKLDLEQSVL